MIAIRMTPFLVIQIAPAHLPAVHAALGSAPYPPNSQLSVYYPNSSAPCSA